MTGLTTEVFREPNPDWRAFESALHEAGQRVPFAARSAWAEAIPHPTWLIGVRSGGRPVDAIGIEITRSRAVPGYQVWRVVRVGGPGALEPKIAACEALVRLARRHRVLRVAVEIVERDHARRRGLAEALRRLGLELEDAPRNYTATSVIDLQRSEDELLAAMRPSTRRHLRATERGGFRVRCLDTPEWSGAVADVAAKTWQRTGGRMPPHDWDAILRVCGEAPDSSVVYGLLNPPGEGVDDQLLAFGWGCLHGDHAHYEAGGSVRFAGKSPPLTYEIMWQLMKWAASQGAAWFDLGGVPVAPADDPAGRRLQDIARFKRGFGGTEQEVAEEWVLAPHPTVARIAEVLGGLARRVTG